MLVIRPKDAMHIHRYFVRNEPSDDPLRTIVDGVHQLDLGLSLIEIFLVDAFSTVGAVKFQQRYEDILTNSVHPKDRLAKDA